MLGDLGARKLHRARGAHAGQMREARRIRAAPGAQCGAWRIQHRCFGLRQQLRGGVHRGRDQIGVADGVEDKIVARRRARPVIGIDDRRFETRVVDQMADRHIAAHRRHQHEQRHRLALAAIGQVHRIVIAITDIAMARGGGEIAKIEQDARHRLMRAGMSGRKMQRHFRMIARRGEIVAGAQSVGEIHMAHRILRMTRHRARISGARGAAVVHVVQQRAQIVERAEMIRDEFQDFEISRPGLIALPAPGQPVRARKQSLGVQRHGRALEGQPTLAISWLEKP